MSSESPAVLAARAALASIDLTNYDPEQSRLMDEKCILVDEQDNAIGAMDKKTCESMCYIAHVSVIAGFNRSSHGEYQQGSFAPSLLSIHFPPLRWQAPPAATCFGEDYLPRHVDKYMLFASTR